MQSTQGDAGQCSLCEPSSKRNPSGSLPLCDVELSSFLQTHIPSTTAPQDPYSPHSQKRNNSEKASQFPMGTSVKEGLGVTQGLCSGRRAQPPTHAGRAQDPQGGSPSTVIA